MLRPSFEIIKTILYALIFLFVMPFSSFALEPVIIDDSLNSIELGSHLEYLKDSDGSLSFYEIIQGRNTEKPGWIRSKEDKLGFGFSRSVYWVRFSLKNPTQRQITCYLNEKYPLIDYLTLYVPDSAGNYKAAQTGVLYPFSERPVKYRTFVFPLIINAKNTVTCYLRFQTTSSINIQLSAMSQAGFRKIRDDETIFYWMYYGILLVMFIYNLIIFINTVDWNYFYFICYIASLGLFSMALNGMAYQYLWPGNMWLGKFATPIAMLLIAITIIIFSMSFIKVNMFSKFWDLILKAFVVLSIITLAITLLIRDYYISINAANILAGAGSVIGIAVAINFAFFKKSRPGIIIFMAAMSFFSGVLMLVFQTEGKLPATVVTTNGIIVGSTLQMILLSFGLADRINIMRNELEILNAGLESKVQERTAEIQTANVEIEAMNQNLIETRDSLWGEMQLAKKIQTVLLPEKPAINGYEISTYMKTANDVGGDYYDIINAGNMDWIIIGDVSGHGVSAGVVMMMVQTSINTIIMDKPDMPPSEVLVRVNKTIYRNLQRLEEDKYMTITAIAAHKDGNFVFSGLHLYILVYRKNRKEVDLLGTKGMWLGIWNDIGHTLANDKFCMEPGDTILLYTDGITEAWKKGSVRDNRNMEFEMFGIERLKNILKMDGDKSLLDIKNEIITSLDDDYVCQDDVTIVLIRRSA